MELIEENPAGRTIMDTQSAISTPNVPASPAEFSATKLLNGVEESYDPGIKLLDINTKEHESGISDHSARNGDAAVDALGIVKEPEAEYGGEHAVMEAMVHYGSASERKAEFEAKRDKAVAERGSVMPGLNEKSVPVVEVAPHDFTGDKPIKKAKKWARENLTGEYELTDSDGQKVAYTISGKAIDKMLSSSATQKSENLGIHLSVLKQLPEVISHSVEAEVHPDYSKGEQGIRTQENVINPRMLVHRFYGAASCNGSTYRVKTTVFEHIDVANPTAPHSFEVADIKALDIEPSAKVGAQASASSKREGTLGIAKLLNGVEKSYDSGVKLLDVSQKEHKSGISDHSPQYGDAAVDTLDGVVRFEEGEGVDVLLSGEEQRVTIGKAEVDENGAATGNVSVTLADGRVVLMSKEEVQAAASAFDEARVAGASEKSEAKGQSDGAAKTNEEKISPVGHGVFGDIFASFRGKAKAALDFLSRKKSGQAKGVFFRPEIGDIDLVWGDAPTAYSGKGLAHIDRKHVKTLGDFSSMEEAIEVIDEIIKNGTFTEQDAKTAVFDKGDYRVVV